MADYQHERSSYVAVTIAYIVCHHHSTITRFENKNQATNDVKDLPRSRRPPKHLLGKIKVGQKETHCKQYNPKERSRAVAIQETLNKQLFEIDSSLLVIVR